MILLPVPMALTSLTGCRMKLDVPVPDSKDKSAAHLFCDPRLERLKISYWTDVPISNHRAAAAISNYLQTEHPAIALFDAGLFVGDLLGKRNRYCSHFLVNALLAYAMVSRDEISTRRAQNELLAASI